MPTAAHSPASMLPAKSAVSRSRRTDALVSLMNFYEQAHPVEEPVESETELMVLLSGMVAVDMSVLDGK